MQNRIPFGKKKLSIVTVLTVTSLILTALIAGTTVLPAAKAAHPPETIARVEYANLCAPGNPDAGDPSFACGAGTITPDFTQTRVTDALSPDSRIGTATGGTVVSTDSLIKFRDTVVDNVWIAGPGRAGGGQTSSSECVFRDADSDGVVDAGEAIGGTCPGSGDVKIDPKIKFLDASPFNGIRDSTEKVFYDFNSNNIDETGTGIGTIIFNTDIIMYNIVDVSSWQVKVAYDNTTVVARQFTLPSPGFWPSQGGSGFPSIDNNAGEAVFGLTLLGGNAANDPGPQLMVTIGWRVVNEGAANIHLVTEVEDELFGIKVKDSAEAPELPNTEDGFVSTVASISALPDPEFTFAPANPVSPGATVNFDTVGSADVDTFAWDFGDGTTGSGATPSHSYASACDPAMRPRPLDTGGGCYRVFLNGTSTGIGSAVSTKIIIVAAPTINPTTTAVICTPAATVVGTATSCTATVTDTSATPTTPTGLASFATGGTGTFSAGSCTLAGSGASASCSVDYTPTSVGTGTHTITGTYDGDTGHSGSSNIFDVSVTQLNQAPVAVDDSYNTAEDVQLVVNAPGVLGNDNDPDGDAITAVLGTSTSNGVLTLNGDGSFSYTPNTNFNGADSFTYRANDGSLDSGLATVMITVTAVNDAPVASDDSYSTAEDTPLSVPAPGVLANDVDVDGPSPTAVLVTGPSSGTLTLNADGSFTYTPNSNFFGSDSFTYRANDGSASSGVATVTITVTAVNDAPLANNDSHSAAQGTTLTVTAPGVLGNDVDVDGDTLTAVLVTGPTSGTLTLNGDGSFTYTPNSGFSGADSFTYRANDGTANSNVATVTINVAANASPTADDDSYTTNEDTALNVPTATGVLANDSDPENNPLTAILISSPSSGTLTLNADGSFSYTPAPNFNGQVTFTYQANDGFSNSNVATVTITVQAVNDAPVANDDAYSTNEDTVLTIPPAIGVLSNDTDPDADPLTAALVSGPSSGTLTLNGDGSFTYTPNLNFFGSDSFTYRASDGSLQSSIATVTITVNPVNDAPVASDDAYSAAQGTTLTVPAPGVLGNDNDVDGDTLTSVLVSSTSNGVLILNSDGSFTYTPNAGFGGPDSFTYRANDGTTDSNVATVTINVAANASPTAVDDSYTTDEDTALNVPAGTGVLANDSDPENNPLTAVLVAGPSSGTLTLNPDGSFTYTPNANFNGADSFTYRANDGFSNSNTATVTITVQAVNDAPVAVDDSYSTAEDTALNIPAPGVLSNDSDADGPSLSTVLVTGPSSGTLTLNSDGSFTYTPNLNFFGSDSFTYRASDGSLQSNIGTVTITVTAVNDAPVAVDDNYSAAQDGVLNVPVPGVLTNDSDVDGPSLTAVLVSSTSSGTLTLNSDGSFTYTPNAGFSGTDSFTYRANDGSLDSNVGTVTITVAENVPPVADDDAYTTAEDTTLNVPIPGVLSNDSDFEGSPLTAILVTTTSNGVLTLNADGSFTYVPGSNFFGSDSFTYQASDGTSLSTSATVTITVTAVNDAPVAVDDSYSTDEDTALDVPAPGVLANDSDVDGDVLTAVVQTAPSHGTLTLNSDGSFVYTPDPNFFGTDTFTYGADDGVTSTEATVTITIAPVNDAPVAVDDSYSTNRDTTLTVNAPGVLSNDVDVDGDSLAALLVSGPASGSLTLNADGSFVYTPNTGFTGTDSFVYSATDGSLSDQATVTIRVTAELAPPVISGKTATGIFTSNPDALFTTEPVVFTVTANDPDGGAIVSSTWNFGDGTPMVTVSGTMTTHTYTRAGTYTVTVFVTDDEGDNSAPFDPSITVDPEPRLARGKLSWTHHNTGDNEFTARVQNPSQFSLSVYVQITLVPRDPGLPILFAFSNAKVLTADSSVQDLTVVVSGSLLNVTKYDLEAVLFYSLTTEPGALPDGAFPVPTGTLGLIGNVIVSPPGVQFTAPGYASNTVAKKTGAFAQLD